MNRTNAYLQLSELRHLVTQIAQRVMDLEQTIDLNADESESIIELAPFDEDASGDWLGLKPNFDHPEWLVRLDASQSSTAA